MNNQDTNQPVAGEAACGKFRNFQKTQNIVFGGWCMDSI